VENMSEIIGEIVGLIDELAAADADRPEHYVWVGVWNLTDFAFERCEYQLDGCHVYKNKKIINGAPPERLK
jgi:hypothetical protein